MLSRSDLTDLLAPSEVASAVEAALRDLDDGSADQPHAALVSGHGDAQFVPMAASWEHAGLAGVKLLADIPSNRERSLPTQQSVLMLLDHADGTPVALLDGAVPTRLRTAAVSAIATRHLARPDWSVLGLIGAGALAIEHVRAHLVDRSVEKVMVWSRSSGTVAAFTERLAEFAPEVTISAQPDPRGVVDGADVVCTLTPAREPIVYGHWLRPGQHLNVVGAPPRPDHREVDGATMAAGLLVVDTTGTALHESGDALQAIVEGALTREDCSLELSSVIAGTAAGRRDSEQVTVFNSVGVGLQDVAVGRLLVDAATAAGRGSRIRLDR